MFELSTLGIEYSTLFIFGALLLLLLTGMPLAFVTLLISLILTLMFFGYAAIPLITSRVFSFVSNFVFVSVPMFVLMASVLDRSTIARDLFDAMQIIGNRIRGGVAIQTIFVSVMLAAMSGIIGGEIVLLGLMALPQMLRLGYDRKLAIGVVCAGGSLGTMIPPSIVLVVYGLTANVSVSDLFTASILPGLMLATLYILYVLFRSYTSDAAPIVLSQNVSISEKFIKLKGLILPLLVVAMVLGSIYGGIASVTEASAIGAFGVIMSTVFRGEFTWKMLKEAALQTLKTTSMIVWIGIGASALIGVYNLMGGIQFMTSLITGVSENPLIVILTMMLVLFILGMFLDWVGIALLTMPVFVPVVINLGYDPVWFGVLFAMNMQVSFLTPPFGPAAFYLKSVTPREISLREIFGSLLPFITIQVFCVFLLVFFPNIAAY
ncbi:MAG TPA: C4-dicarboxylate ABC transporter permease [Rhodobacteraceae bacterium]|nr:C4-dicarboxylate ABC transporter permease [Paracoccaceae bacterium]